MKLFLLFLLFRKTFAVVYQLNDTEYVRMPPLFHLDPYESCVNKAGGIYCTVDIDLVANDDNDLLQMIKEYSDRSETHFNHSRLRHGVCVTTSCKYLMEEGGADREVIEECLNDTFRDKYELGVKLDEISCNDVETFELDPADIAVAAVCLGILLLNLLGSIYDFLLRRKPLEGNQLLLCFSIMKNWNRLTGPSETDNDVRKERFKCFNGLRVLTIACVIIHHSLLPFVIAADNTHFYEKAYSNLFYHLLYDGTLVVQTFFIMSGCLFSYHLEMHSEKERLNWWMIPKIVLMRWLRLTPPYAVVLMMIMTWVKYAGSGPLWHTVIYPEVQDCRRDGWQNMIYLNNYFDNTQCMTHTWYLAADMQLFIMGLITLVLFKSIRTRKVVLSLIFAVSIIILPLHTYFQDLNAHLIITPEVARSHFVRDPTFNNTYKRGHTNITSYVLGLVAGILIHRLQKKPFDIERYKKYKYLIWATFPIAMTLILGSSLLYRDEVTPSLIVRTIFSGILKPGFGILIFVLVMGVVFKIENVYRPLLEWRGWSSPARVSYSAYVLHLTLVQILTGSRTTLIHITEAHIILVSFGTCFISFLAAVPFWLIVEAPIAQVIKFSMSKGSKEENCVEQNYCNGNNNIKTES